MTRFRLTQGNCIGVLRQMPDKSVDCIVTDPPYGIGVHFADVEDTAATVDLIVDQALPEMRRVARRVVLIPGIANMMRYPQPSWILIYQKHGTYCSWGWNRWNPILVYGSDPDLRAGIRRPDVITRAADPKEGITGHPCPKPLWLMRRLINRVAPSPADIILDPFMGSGTTGVAAIQLGHQFIGIELNGDYLAIAERRIAQASPDFHTTINLTSKDYTHGPA